MGNVGPYTVDHVVAKARGGTDHIENLQLLCGACNSMKGTKTQEEFLAALRSRYREWRWAWRYT